MDWQARPDPLKKAGARIPAAPSEWKSNRPRSTGPSGIARQPLQAGACWVPAPAIGSGGVGGGHGGAVVLRLKDNEIKPMPFNRANESLAKTKDGRRSA